jgi:hypothetical protein
VAFSVAITSGAAHYGMFLCPPQDVPDPAHQKAILTINERQTSMAYHLSAVFPREFGTLAADDRVNGFDGAQFRRWTKKRRIASVGEALRKQDASFGASAHACRTSKSAQEKRLAGRRRQIELAKDEIYEVECDTMRSGDAATNAHAQSLLAPALLKLVNRTCKDE